MKKILFSLVIALLVTIIPTTAFVDLITPADNNHTNQEEIAFEFYVGLEDPQTCNLQINEQEFEENNPQQGINNKISVQNIPEGTYNWVITCTNATQTSTSNNRTITIDQTKPTIDLRRPDLTESQLFIRLKTDDALSSQTTCAIHSNNEFIDEITINTSDWFEKTYSQQPGDYELNVTCQDKAENQETIIREYEIDVQDFFHISTNKQEYRLGEQMYLTVDAPQDANVSIDICPNKQGFVECLSPIVLQEYPQTIQLPLNQSGSFIIDGFMQTPRGSLFNSTNYTIDNTIQLSLETNGELTTNNEFELQATTQGTIGEPTYTWTLHNQTTKTTTNNVISQTHTTPGTRTDQVTITDEAGNTKTASIEYSIEQTKEVTILVVDDQENPLENAQVSRSETSTTKDTSDQGTTLLTLPLGTHKLYVSKEGYNFVYEEYEITSSTEQLTIPLSRNQEILLDIISPQDGEEINTLNIQFTLEGTDTASCALYLGSSDESFLEEYQTITANEGENSFLINNQPAGEYSFFIECEQEGKTKNTQTKTITLTPDVTDAQAINTTQESIPATTTGLDESIDEIIDALDKGLEMVKSAGPKEQELISTLRIESAIRSAKRLATMGQRDLFDLERRASSTQEEKDEIRERIQQLAQETITKIEVHEDKTYVAYINQEEIASLIEEHGEEIDISADEQQALEDAQQSYTLTTNVYRATITYANQQEKPMSLVKREFSYAQTNRGDTLIELLPDPDAEYTFLTDGSRRIGESLVRFEPAETIVYHTTEDLTLDQLEQTRALLLPEIRTQNRATGYSVYGVLEAPLEHTNKALIILMILLSVWVANYFGLVEQAKYFAYQGSNKKPLHYLRVLLNDVHDQLAAKNYSKALLVYKEAKLSYEQLSTPAKNEVYEELITACSALDKYFMKQLVIELDKALKEERLEEAIDYFAKIEGTYERLPQQEQEQVHTMITGLAKRLGVHA